LAHDARQVACDVDDGVPRTPTQRVEVSVAVAVELLGLGKEVRVRLAAVEERDFVPACERSVDGRASEELRPAED
jgi:hypothetical protein